MSTNFFALAQGVAAHALRPFLTSTNHNNHREAALQKLISIGVPQNDAEGALVAARWDIKEAARILSDELNQESKNEAIRHKRRQLIAKKLSKNPQKMVVRRAQRENQKIKRYNSAVTRKLGSAKKSKKESRVRFVESDSSDSEMEVEKLAPMSRTVTQTPKFRRGTPMPKKQTIRFAESDDSGEETEMMKPISSHIALVSKPKYRDGTPMPKNQVSRVRFAESDDSEKQMEKMQPVPVRPKFRQGTPMPKNLIHTDTDDEEIDDATGEDDMQLQNTQNMHVVSYDEEMVHASVLEGKMLFQLDTPKKVRMRGTSKPRHQSSKKQESITKPVAPMPTTTHSTRTPHLTESAKAVCKVPKQQKLKVFELANRIAKHPTTLASLASVVDELSQSFASEHDACLHDLKRLREQYGVGAAADLLTLLLKYPVLLSVAAMQLRDKAEKLRG